MLSAIAPKPDRRNSIQSDTKVVAQSATDLRLWPTIMLLSGKQLEPLKRICGWHLRSQQTAICEVFDRSSGAFCRPQTENASINPVLDARSSSSLMSYQGR